LTLVRRINAAIAGQLTAVRDTADILTALGAAGCTRCGALAAPPCFDASCQLSASTVVDLSGAVLGAPTGNLDLTVCRDAALLGSDFGLFAGPGKTVKPFPIPTTGQTVCISAVGGQGYIAGTGSTLDLIDTESCQDHMSQDLDGDECPSALLAAVPICAEPALDPHVAHALTTNAGVCMTFDDSAAAAGDAFLMGSVRLTYACDGAANCGGVNTEGADGIPCTSDDTATQGPTFIFPLTTGTAAGMILDANNTDANSSGGGPFSGIAFDVPEVSAGDLSAGVLVASVPGLHTNTAAGSPPGDAVLSVSLECE
jgi:hypothetical protein